MTIKQRAQWVLQTLQGLYPDPPVPLDHSDPFTLLIAVLLSAQCTDERVNRITPVLFSRFGTRPEDFASQPVEAVLEVVKPCGLGPQKARAIVGLSRLLMDDHGGRVPADLEALERLPGVGHKTAQVVMAQSFGVPSFPVDTHIHRLAARWRLSNGKSVERTERDLKRLFAPETWNALHLQIIFYGREYCTARGCDGRTCPICSHLNPPRSAKGRAFAPSPEAKMRKRA